MTAFCKDRGVSDSEGGNVGNGVEIGGAGAVANPETLLARALEAGVISLALGTQCITTMFFSSFFTTVALLVWLIMVLILLVRTVKLGIELLILRLGFPFATLGLIDSDMALFKNYIQVFIKTFFTLIIQVVLLSLSMRVIASTTSTLFGWLFGIALASTALSAPKLLQQFLAPSGGGGGGAMYKLSSAAMLARSVAALFV